jgi:hypothetical protein
MALSIVPVVSGNRVLNGNGGYKLDFYGDKVHSYPKTSLQACMYVCMIYNEYEFYKIYR